MSDILKLENSRPGLVRVKPIEQLLAKPPAECKPPVQTGGKRKTVMKSKGTQTEAFNAIARLEKEFGKASKDLGISDKLKAKVMSASLEIQERFYYR